MNNLIGSAQRFVKGIKATGGTYNQGGIKSIGGKIGTSSRYLGGTLGVDNGKPFGNANISGKSIGSFGPQGK